MTNSAKTRVRHRQTRKSSLKFDKLEAKNLLAGISFNDATGVVTIDGSAVADYAQVFDETNQIKVTLSNFGSQSFDANSVNEVVFIGRSGNDWFRNNTSVDSRAYGHDGNDNLIGGSGNDRLRGGNHQDRLVGNEGRDYTNGDDGNDVLIGGDDNDRMLGGEGNDNLRGDSGNDHITGGRGDDVAYGGSGNDRVFGFDGRDKLLGGSGNDLIAGQNGDDFIYGEDGRDQLYGNDGGDVMVGGADADRVVGGIGNDRLMGHSGIDEIFGQEGNDWLSGGEDADRLFGDAGNDDVFGGDGDDFIQGGAGLDNLFGQDGRDALFGQDGNDDLYGGRDSDSMRGGLGNDDFFNDSSDDVYEDDDDYSSDGDFEIRGVVSGYDDTAMTFSVLGLSIDFFGAEVAGTIGDGSFVKVEGTFDGTVVFADEVELEDDDNRDENFEARGMVENLDAAAQTFQMFGLTIDFDSADVEGELVDGANVEVEGWMAGTTVTADEVEVSDRGGGNDDDDNDDDGDRDHDRDGDLELRGEVTNLDTANKTFSLLGVTVNYSSSQLTDSFANGSFVKAEGLYDGSELVAREVESEDDDDRDENIEARGVVSNLDEIARTFEILGFTVEYSDSDVEDPFANGDSVEVEGWLENLTISADRINR